jgi:Xaa-Pro aminopeptidase
MNYLLSDENAIYHRCGFSCDNVIYLKHNDKSFFITDSRYTHEARENITSKNTKVIEASNLTEALDKIIQKRGIKKLTINPDDFTISQYNSFKFKNFKFKSNFSQLNRIIKSNDEIKMLKKASLIAKKSFEEFALYLSNYGFGKSEKTLHFEAIRYLSDSGKYSLSFDPIFAINANSAKPHALPTDDTLEDGSIVLLDAGIKYQRYCSDRTATAYYSKDNGISFKRDQKFKSKKMQKVYDTVRKAQEKAIDKARVGMRAKDIDKIARDVIDKAGYGKYFIHSTGHGVGLDIHELPVINKKNKTIIEDNMIFTIEPGIYLNDKFGVRIEDTVAMINGRAQIL